jgi:hypothetical protein
VLATPANAESLRLSWCDLQLAFLARDPGRAYSPPIRLLSRLGVGDLEERIPSGSSPVKSGNAVNLLAPLIPELSRTRFR